MTEKWRSVVGFESVYQVSNMGRVWSNRRRRSTYGMRTKWVGGHFLRPCASHNGYMVVCLTLKPGESRNFRLHRLVAIAFMGDLTSDGLQVHHKDGDKENNVLDNLAWVTPEENIRHATVTGLIRSGAEHPRAKLSDANVIDIRHRRRKGASLLELSQEYGVTRTSISSISRRNSWTRTG